MIVIAKETLGFRCAGLSPALRLLMPTFSLLTVPPKLTLWLQHSEDAPLPRTAIKLCILIFGIKFSPGNLWRKTPELVSCYALFKG